MVLGIVKWFDKGKGFGIVENPNEGKFFLHMNNFITRPESISKGTAVVFKKQIDNKNGRKIAEKCRLIGELDDWKLIMDFLDKPDSIRIEIEVTGRGKRGNPYRYKETNAYSLRNLSAKQLFRKKSEDEILSMLVNYFDNDLDKNLFIHYCNFIEERVLKNIIKEKATTLLSNVFNHFGNNLTEAIVFYTWKNKSFKYIDYTGIDEYKIPENLLKIFSSEIGVPELRRIKDFEFGPTFCNEFVSYKFAALNNLNCEELKVIYQFIDCASEDKRKIYKPELDKIFTEKILNQFIEKADKLGPIDTNDDFNKYSYLKQITTNQVGEELKPKVDEAINKIIISKSTEEFKPDLWIKGIVENAPFEFVSKTFHNSETRNEKRVSILLKLEPDQQLILLKAFSENSDWENSFNIIESFLKKVNSLENSAKFIEIINQITDKFSFGIYNSIDRFKSFIPYMSLTDELRTKLREKLNLERAEIETDKLIEIFSKLKAYEIIKDQDHLLELLADRVLNCSELTHLISFLSNSVRISLFRSIILYNKNKFPPWQKIELLESSEQKKDLAKVIIDECFSIENDDSISNLLKVIDFLGKSKNWELATHFLDKFYEGLSPKYPIQVLNLALLSNHINAQKLSYQHLTFNSENEIVNFIDKVKDYNFSNEIRITNKPLTDYIEFMNAASDFDLTEDCKKFLQLNKGIVQCLSVKYLIYQFHKKVITKTKLVEIINSCQWTEISALLIKAFIQESNYTEKILLDRLNGIFKEHFEILSNQKFEPKSFLDNFTIRNILNRCDGRKHYNAEFWQKNGVSRWYVNGGVSIYTKDTMICYCEGRPWKKESLWNSQTNKPSAEQYEFYWCRTSYCAARNDTINLNQPFNQWTLSEISAALNINIEKIALATLSGWVNRMNQIVEHLFCRSCKEVLRPLPFRPSTLGYYAVPLFHCINDRCTDKQTIRFTHCLNGKCESHKTSEPLDSRDCESCRPGDPNHTGLKCNYCGASCPVCSGHNNRIVAKEVW